MNTKFLRVIFISLGIIFCFIAKSTEADHLQVEKTRLLRAEKTYMACKKKFLKVNISESCKSAYVNSTVAYATIVMKSPALPPKIKYAKALRLYREALKVSPKNPEALANSRMIESIYKSMNRPIPE